MNDDQRMLLQEVDRACRELRPYEEECYLSHRFNDRLVPLFVRAHLLGLPIREEYGGAGADLMTYVLALERIGREGTSARTFFSAHVSLGALVVQQWGSEAQKRRLLPEACCGERVFAFALTEPAAGSDPGALRTHFEETGGAFRLNGGKHWISNGTIATTVIVFARDRADGQISALLVDATTPGFVASPQQHKMGIHSADTGVLAFDDCVVPVENLLGPRGKGMSVAYSALMNGRLSVAAGNLGVMQDCLDEATDYARQRVQHGKPIGRHQLVQRHLAIISTNLEAARGLTYDATRRKMEYEATNERTEDAQTRRRDDAGTDPSDPSHPSDPPSQSPELREARPLRDAADTQIARAKYFTANAAFDAAHRAVQIFGSAGYSLESRVARHECDTRVTQIYEGTNEILEQKIAVSILGRDFAAYC